MHDGMTEVEIIHKKKEWMDVHPSVPGLLVVSVALVFEY